MANRTIRLFLALEAASFASASLIHSGHLVAGYEHRAARIAEAVIAAVLLVGLIAAVALPVRARRVGLTVQGFALLGTMVGIFTIVVGVGPRTAPDIVYHVAIAALLAWGLYATARSRETTS